MSDEERLIQAQETLRALEAVAINQGWRDRESECLLVDWFDEQLKDLRKLTEGIFGIHDVDATLREVKEILKERDQARQKLEGAEEVFRLIRMALWGHNKEGDIVGAVKNLRQRLQEEQETMRALEAVAVEHGYDMETGECLTDWFSGLVVQRDTARAAADHWKRKYNEKVNGGV